MISLQAVITSILSRNKEVGYDLLGTDDFDLKNNGEEI